MKVPVKARYNVKPDVVGKYSTYKCPDLGIFLISYCSVPCFQHLVEKVQDIICFENIIAPATSEAVRIRFSGICILKKLLMASSGENDVIFYYIQIATEELKQ